jgi:hypothetical protein
MSSGDKNAELPQGTLDFILHALSTMGPLHSALATCLAQVSNHPLSLTQRAQYYSLPEN